MSRAVVPGHVTGFFAVQREDEPLRAGSIGCGFTLGMNATTAVEPSEETAVVLDGQESPAPVSRHVIDALAPSPVRVTTDLEMPPGSGFGASGAGALGCAYALNHHFGLGLTANGAAAAAHVAEVINATGLGDVVAQNTGGLVVRVKAGGPGIGTIDRIPVPPTGVDCVVKGPISTKDVLSDSRAVREINLAGARAVKDLLARPTLENFMLLSRRFASQSGLASDWALDVMEAVEASGGMASMVMLGDAVFAIGAGRTLEEFGDVYSTQMVQGGARLD